MNNTILLKGTGISKEALSAAAITPGYLVERVSGAATVQKHSTAGGKAAPVMFAMENELDGDEITDDYASGETVHFLTPYPGSEIYALVAASAVAIVIGDRLESAGDGTLRKATVGDVADYTITWTANEPTAGDTATIADGTTPTVAELGQAVADITAKLNALLPGALENVVAVAIEAVDNSGGGSEARIKVEVL